MFVALEVNVDNGLGRGSRKERDEAKTSSAGSESPLRLLSVESDSAVAAAFLGVLAECGLHAECALGVDDAIGQLRESGYDLLLVDSCLSGAKNLAQSLRTEHPEVGLVLVKSRLEADDPSGSLEEYFDDCVGRDSEPKELHDRLRTVFGKVQRAAPATIHSGPIQVDLLRGYARVFGRPVELQPLQLRLLGYLAYHAGRVVEHDEVRQNVFRSSRPVSSTSIARQVSVLRRRLGAYGTLLVTVRGGYVLMPQAGGLGAPRSVRAPGALR